MVWTENSLSHEIIGCALAIHRSLGAGLLESAYQRCMEIELECRGIQFERQKTLALTYRGRSIPDAYRLDLVVENLVLVEIKAVQRWDPVFEAQVITYLKLTGLRLGLLLNFHSNLIRDGITRIANGLADTKPEPSS